MKNAIFAAIVDGRVFAINYPTTDITFHWISVVVVGVQVDFNFSRIHVILDNHAVRVIVLQKMTMNDSADPSDVR